MLWLSSSGKIASSRQVVGLDDLRGLFQAQQFLWSCFANITVKFRLIQTLFYHYPLCGLFRGGTKSKSSLPCNTLALFNEYLRCSCSILELGVYKSFLYQLSYSEHLSVDITLVTLNWSQWYLKSYWSSIQMHLHFLLFSLGSRVSSCTVK